MSKKPLRFTKHGLDRLHERAKGMSALHALEGRVELAPRLLRLLGVLAGPKALSKEYRSATYLLRGDHVLVVVGANKIATVVALPVSGDVVLAIHLLHATGFFSLVDFVENDSPVVISHVPPQ